jgi:hypothetical protein
LRQVKHQVLDWVGQHQRELAFQFGCGGGVEAAGEFHGDGSSVLAAGGLEGQYFEWHIGFAFWFRFV